MNQSQKQKIVNWLAEFPGDTICVRQIWYECLLGNGVPDPEIFSAIEDIVNNSDDWEDIGGTRYEKMGLQPAYRRKTNPEPVKRGRIMVQHMFKLGSVYRDPEGRLLKVVLSEVFNIRCFELKDGSMVGRMIKFDPCSEYAKTLVEVA